MTDDAPEPSDSTDPEDPFDRLGRATDREGDPFERLDDDEPRAGGAEDETADDEPWVPPGEDRREPGTGDERVQSPAPGTGPADGVGDDTGAGAAVDDSFEETGEFEASSDPFANVDTPSESAFEGPGNVFERVDSGAADPDQVWESITGEDEDSDGDEAEPSVPDEGRYSDVSKHRFCEGCEHFSPPPDVACGHHTAEIVEFLDMDTVRLRNCPVVAEREELERSG